jgi:polar amino acid transport system substrate-binding protein
LIEEGDAFAAFPYVKNADREKTFLFSDPVASTTGKLFYYKPNFKSKTTTFAKYEDLKPFNIGGVIGYWYVDVFKKANLKTDYAPKEEVTLTKLVEGRVDLIVLDEVQGWTLIKQLYPDKVDQFGVFTKNLNEDPLFLMVSKKYPNSKAVLEKFNKGLKSAKDKGLIAAIKKKFGVAGK